MNKIKTRPFDVCAPSTDTLFKVIKALKALKWMLGIIVGGVVMLVLRAFFPV